MQPFRDKFHTYSILVLTIPLVYIYANACGTTDFISRQDPRLRFKPKPRFSITEVQDVIQILTDPFQLQLQHQSQLRLSIINLPIHITTSLFHSSQPQRHNNIDILIYIPLPIPIQIHNQNPWI